MSTQEIRRSPRKVATALPALTPQTPKTKSTPSERRLASNIFKLAYKLYERDVLDKVKEQHPNVKHYDILCLIDSQWREEKTYTHSKYHKRAETVLKELEWAKDRGATLDQEKAMGQHGDALVVTASINSRAFELYCKDRWDDARMRYPGIKDKYDLKCALNQEWKRESYDTQRVYEIRGQDMVRQRREARERASTTQKTGDQVGPQGGADATECRSQEHTGAEDNGPMAIGENNTHGSQTSSEVGYDTEVDMDDDASQAYDAEWDDSDSIEDDEGQVDGDLRDFATPEDTEDREPAGWELDLAMGLSGDWDEYTLEQWSGGPRLGNTDLPLQFCPFDLISDPE